MQPAKSRLGVRNHQRPRKKKSKALVLVVWGAVLLFGIAIPWFVVAKFLTENQQLRGEAENQLAGNEGEGSLASSTLPAAPGEQNWLERVSKLTDGTARPTVAGRTAVTPKTFYALLDRARKTATTSAEAARKTAEIWDRYALDLHGVIKDVRLTSGFFGLGSPYPVVVFSCDIPSGFPGDFSRIEFMFPHEQESDFLPGRGLHIHAIPYGYQRSLLNAYALGIDLLIVGALFTPDIQPPTPPDTQDPPVIAPSPTPTKPDPVPVIQDDPTSAPDDAYREYWDAVLKGDEEVIRMFCPDEDDGTQDAKLAISQWVQANLRGRDYIERCRKAGLTTKSEWVKTHGVAGCVAQVRELQTISRQDGSSEQYQFEYRLEWKSGHWRFMGGTEVQNR